MKNASHLFILGILVALTQPALGQPYFQGTATIEGNSILYKIKAVGGNVTTGWSDIEFFFRNPTAAPDADPAFSAATITVNTTDFPGVVIPYNGKNIQGSESGYNNYWFGVSFSSTTPRTYNQNQEYLVCTIALADSPAGFGLELCHNEPGFTPHYIVLTDPVGIDLTNLTGSNKFYGPDTVICMPNNCPVSTPGNNHILPLSGAQPVELIDFQARLQQPHRVRLFWRTASEINVDGFEIERQINTGPWVHIGTLPSKVLHGGGADYTFFDNKPTGPTVYYRLKIVDHDGLFEYSTIRQVYFDDEVTLRIFPNPTSGVLYLACGATLPADRLLIELQDWSGRIVIRQVVEVLPGTTTPLILTDHHLPSGMYQFHATTPEGFDYWQQLAIAGGQ